jgi:hypothetical protein
MKFSVKGVRDSDGALLGETIFDITDKKNRNRAVTKLLNQVYAALPDDLIPPPSFTLKFAKAEDSK